MRGFFSAFFIAIGIVAMVSGEADDSPGLQGLGLILIISVIIVAYRSRSPK
jgi:hypothetical protein